MERDKIIMIVSLFLQPNSLMKQSCLLIALLFFITSCRKDGSESDFKPATGIGNYRTTKVMGVVKKSNGNAYPGCTVQMEGNIATTNADGFFVFDEISIPTERAILSCSSPGGEIIYKAFVPGDVCSYVTLKYAEGQIFSGLGSVSETYVTKWGAEVTIPANALEDESGVPFNDYYDIEIQYLNPDSMGFSQKVPGGDLFAENDRILYSYGMMNVEMRSGNTKLKLRTATNAIVKMPIPLSVINTAPAVIPAWHFNESTVLWEEEGTATRNGSYYIMTVHHFSWWNSDSPFPRAYIKGKIVGCNGTTFPNVVYTVNNMYTGTTDANGFYNVWVPAGIALKLQVLSGYNANLIANSAPVTIAPLADGQIFTVSTITLACGATITGQVTSCFELPYSCYVYYTYNGNTIAGVVQNDSFQMYVPLSASIDLHIVTPHTSTVQTISTPSQNVNITIPINVCDSDTVMGIPENCVLVHGGPWNNLLIQLDTSVVFKATFYQNWQVNLTCGMIGTNEEFYLNLSSAIPGQHLASVFGAGTVFYRNVTEGISMNIPTGIGSGFYNLIQIAPVGGRIKATIDIVAPYTVGSSTPYTVRLKGKFNFPRLL